MKRMIFRNRLTKPVAILLGLTFFLGSLTVASGDVRREFDVARNAFSAGQYASARLLFENILGAENSRRFADSAQYFIGLAYFMENRFEPAERELRKVWEEYQGSRHAAAARYFAAESLYYLRSYDQALNLHKEFLDIAPKHKYAVRARYTRGYIYLLQKKNDSAIQEFAQAMHDFPKDAMVPELHLKLGEAYFNSGQFEKSRTIYSQILIKAKQAPYSGAKVFDDAHFWIAKTYVAEKNYSEAITQFNKVATVFPKSNSAPHALYQAALAHLQLEQPFEALESLKRLREQYGQHALVAAGWYRQGLILAGQKKHSEAEAAFAKVIWDHPDSRWYPNAVWALGESYLRQNQTGKALKLYEVVTKKSNLAPRYRAAAWLKIGHIYFNERNFVQADRAYSILLNQYPKEPAARDGIYAAAKAKVQMGDPDEALALLNTGLQKYRQKKSVTNYKFLKAEILFKSNRYADALKEYRDLSKAKMGTDRKFAVKMGQAYSYFEQKEYHKAQDAFIKILRSGQFKTHPNRAEAQLGLGATYYNLRKFQSALKTLQAIAGGEVETPAKAKATYEVGWTYYRLGKFSEAATWLGQYATRYPKGERLIEALYYRAWARLKQNKISQANDDFLQVTKLKAVITKGSADYNHFSAVNEQAKLAEFQPLAWFYLGKNSANAAENPLSAIKYFEVITTAYPEHDLADDAYYEMSMLLLDKGQIRAAQDKMDRLAELSPSSPFLPEFYFALAGRHRVDGNPQQAALFYQKILEVYRNSRLAHSATYALALQSYEQKNYQQSLEFCSQYLGQFPNKSMADDIYLLVGRNYKAQGDTNTAISSWETAFNKMVPARRYEARMEIAAVLFEQKNYKAALAELEVLKGKKHQAGQAYFLLGRIAAEQKKEVTSIDYYRLSAKKGQDQWAAQSEMAVGRYYLENGRYKQASLSFVKIAHQYKHRTDIVPEALWGLIECFRKMDNRSEALKYYNRLKAEYAQSPWLKKAQAVF